MRLPEPAAAAREARLRYVSGREPGLTRKRNGRGFRYCKADGSAVTDRASIERIGSLVIPPAWERVWICADPNGHLQATGFDDKGRKQYRYHADWSRARNLSKFDGMARFGRALPAIRRRVRRDQLLEGMPRERVAACIVMLMDRLLVRVGNSEYARDNDSYGLTTIRNSHARVRGGEVRLTFKGKSGRVCDLSLSSARAARIVRHCQQLPGQELFGYIDSRGRARDIGSGDVNDYLFSITGERLTAKDFRTWGGTVIAARTLHESGPPRRTLPDGTTEPLGVRELKRREVAAVRAAAGALCNTPATCRKYYVHPGLIGAYAAGKLTEAFERVARDGCGTGGATGLRREERAVLTLLRGLTPPRAAAVRPRRRGRMRLAA